MGLGKSANIGRTTRNIGSDATGHANRKAASTSIGPVSKVTSSSRGSTAGLRAERTIRLEANGTGYSNPRNMQARYTPKKPMPVANYGSALRSPTPNRVYDRRLTAHSDNSIARIKRMYA